VPEEKHNSNVSGGQDFVNLQIDVGIIKTQILDVVKKVDASNNKLDNLSVVSREEYVSDKDKLENYKIRAEQQVRDLEKYVEKTYVTLDSQKNIKALAMTVLTALTVAAALAIWRLLTSKI
jgi:hypothetical protein